MFADVGILQAVTQCILLIIIGQHNEIGLNEKRSAISNAYLNSPLKDEVYLRHPLKETNPESLPIFLKLKRSLYGLAQSGYNWA